VHQGLIDANVRRFWAAQSLFWCSVPNCNPQPVTTCVAQRACYLQQYERLMCADTDGKNLPPRRPEAERQLVALLMPSRLVQKGHNHRRCDRILGSDHFCSQTRLNAVMAFLPQAVS
jgi:hypothetical protein